MDVVSPAPPLVSCRSIEQHGFVWVCLHQEPLSDAPVCRSWNTDPDFDSFLWESQVEASLPDALENLLDGTHTPFVHAGLIRSEARRQIFSATVRLRDGLVEAEYHDEQKQNGLISQLFERDRTASFGRFIPPCVAELEYRSKQGTEFVLNSHFTPIDDRRLMVHSKIYLRRSRLPFWIKRLALTPFLKRVMHQDQDILKLQQKNIDRFGEAAFQSWEGDLMRGWIDTWLRSGRLPDSVPERTIRFEL
jgi:phenylpropionate dioxygenase-like ring-hydroxylating dioxygenase large terminal subunit